MQFAVKLEVSISRGPNQKMVGKFHIICQNGGVHGFFGIYHLREWREFSVIHNLK